MATTVKEYKQRIDNLPEHDKNTIDTAAQQLEMLHASFYTGSMDLDLKRMSKEEILEVIDSIEKMGIDELRASWMFEPPFDGSNPEDWLKRAKLIRAAYLAEQFELVSRLRDDDPEAWDEINELFFDD